MAGAGAAAGATTTTWARPPRQERSRATMERLLAAAQALLAERRFGEATVADLVRRARTSVGAFYARFPDKEALLHCFDERFFEEGRRRWAEFLDPARWEGATVADVAGALVARLVDARRKNRGLLRALALYVRSRPDPRFRDRAVRLNRFVIDGVRRLLLAHRSEIRHPDPAKAIAFGLAMVDAATREAILFDDIGLHPRLPDRQLAAELTRAYLSYLGVPAGRGRRTRGGSHARS